MTIRFFVLLSIILLLLILVFGFFVKEDRRKFKKSPILVGCYYILLVGLGAASLVTLNKYMYPKDERVFQNVDYHLLEHKGYAFDSVLYLVKDNYMGLSSESFPEEAIWDTKSGLLALTHDSVVIKNYYEPVFIAPSDQKDPSFILANADVAKEISGNVLKISNGSEELVIWMEPYKEKIRGKKRERCHYICQLNGSPKDTSSFTLPIHFSYPINNIISHCRNIDIPETWTNLLDGALLVRQTIETDKLGDLMVSKRNDSPLLFFPGEKMTKGEPIQINDQSIGSFEYHCQIPVNDNVMLFSGVGGNKTDVFRLLPQDGKHAELRYVLPKMQKLREESGQMFLTSSVNEAVNSSLKAGYLYNNFIYEDNTNRINARLKYYVGSSRDSLFVECCDLYADSKTDLLTANNEFQLNTYAKFKNNVQWIFDIKDLRATNSLQWSHVFWFVAIFLILVGMRLVVDYVLLNSDDSNLQRDSLSFFSGELALYVVLLCFGVVRLILAWRMSTFIPTEDIGPETFFMMRNARNIWFFTALFCCGVPILFMVCNIFRHTLQSIFGYIAEKNVSPWRVCLYFLLFLFVVLVLGRIFHSTLLNIPVPVIGYFLFRLWMQQAIDNDDEESLLPRLVIWLLIAAVLFLSDAGYSIIFVLYSVVHFVIIKQATAKTRETAMIKGIAVSLVALCLLILFLAFEGHILIFAFRHVGVVCMVVGVLLGIFSIYAFGKNKQLSQLDWKITAFATAVMAVGVLVLGILDVTHVSDFATEKVNNKIHMKYRAEIQHLGADEKIDDLMLKNDMHSSDITYITWSAHNQWFINIYANRFKGSDKYFALQPHSNQGSSFITQTTDLVITRYVLAEHGPMVVGLLVAVLLLLTIIFSFEVRPNKNNKFVLLGCFLLPFVTALFVFLSATNRIVFFGQDFPFISLISKTAIIYPIALFSMAIIECILDDDDSTDSNQKQRNGLFISLILVVLSMLSVFLIKPKGLPSKDLSAEQLSERTDEQFDVSKLISDIEEKVRPIDRDFEAFQDRVFHNNFRIPRDSVWNRFVSEMREDPSSSLSVALSDSTGNNRFFNSLIRYFCEEQAQKYDPEELLHIHRHNRVYHLAVNKSHYLIRSSVQKDIQWKGDVLSADVGLKYAFADASTGKVDQLRKIEGLSYVLDVLPAHIHAQVPNISIMQLDTSWTPDKEPLLLIRASQSQPSKQYYHIESDSLSIVGSSYSNQVATRILLNDLVKLNKEERGRQSLVMTKVFQQGGRHYIAKNIWLNGRRQLFYPIGKESMWSYNFSNLVNNVYGNSPEFRDSTIRISIDYDLLKNVHQIVQRENRNNNHLDAKTIESLEQFKESNYYIQINRNNKFPLYYDENRKAVVSKIQTGAMARAVNLVNKSFKSIRKDPNIDVSHALRDALDYVIEDSFDYSAVVLDGNGRIRLLYDYDKSRKVDPNNIRYLNKFISDLYKDGSSGAERDIFGNKALMLLVPGPGSSFKPVAYTSLISQAGYINWGELHLLPDNLVENQTYEMDPVSNNPKFFWYGGVNNKVAQEAPWQLGCRNSCSADRYLISSNNLYHSVMILLGMQRQQDLENFTQTIMRPAGNSLADFPVIQYQGQRYAFDEAIWYKALCEKSQVKQGVINNGLSRNFQLLEEMNTGRDLYSNFFGQDRFISILYENSSSSKRWSFMETGSQNNNDRNLPPFVTNGLVKLSLGANPLSVSPLQMASFGMRLATLNNFPNITTLSDANNAPPSYHFFDTPGWHGEEQFLRFYQNQVLRQLRNVPTIGTAARLNAFVRNCESRGYYVYAKTGTLNDDNNTNKNARLKHLLVIISDRPLESVQSVQELQTVKYYVVYLSYLGIDINEFQMTRFANILNAVIDSETFKNYMKNE